MNRALSIAPLAAALMLGGSPAPAADPVVFLTSEDPDNYDAVAFSRGFAAAELRELRLRATVLVGNRARPTDFEGFEEAVAGASLLVIFVRRATPPPAQLDAIRAHLAAGKPLLGIRTANHAFVPPANDPLTDPALAQWPEFVPEVLGCQNTGYETKGLPYAISRHPAAPSDSPLLVGVDPAALRGHVSMYRVLPLAEDAIPLLLGTAPGIEPAQPLAWTRLYGPNQARVFYTSLGAPEDMAQPGVRRLLVNAVRWTLRLDPVE